MKRIFLSVLLVVCAAASWGATLNPIQLLNPVGSTSGQLITSTGPTTAPAWTTVTLSGLSGTVAIANGGTGATSASAALTNLGAAALASPTFTGVPLAPTAAISTYTDQIATTKFVLNQASSSLPLINGTAAVGTSASFARADHVHPTDTTRAAVAGNLSQFASTTSSQLAGVLSDETGSGSAVFSLTPTITAPNIVGTISGGNAAAGSVGEYLSATTAATSLTSAAAANCTSVSLTPGDWDVRGVVKFTPGGSTTPAGVIASINTTSATLGADDATQGFNASFAAASVIRVATPFVRINVSSTTTVYLIGFGIFSGGAETCDGYIRARRVR